MYTYVYTLHIYIYIRIYFFGESQPQPLCAHTSQAVFHLGLHAARAATSTCLRRVSRAIWMKLSMVTWFLGLTSALLTR